VGRSIGATAFKDVSGEEVFDNGYRTLQSQPRL